jgi:hypothetical protein
VGFFLLDFDALSALPNEHRLAVARRLVAPAFRLCPKECDGGSPHDRNRGATRPEIIAGGLLVLMATLGALIDSMSPF